MLQHVFFLRHRIDECDTYRTKKADETSSDKSAITKWSTIAVCRADL